ncbi:PLP-dependent aminotransferase family protein [Zhenhengia yiwuensis]|uniref:Serine hydroxymethyltransferase-like domain-containing protein n=1 Tax=Zhenhengia yiwuensis TaxID=2763666 RepID=A0A926EKJ9_9FIRM|nr:hypothetical protein [Zhenhengia yiwuensis]MBC8580750.1 hypothetical protein [Zhenhengia yiwuensis]
MDNELKILDYIKKNEELSRKTIRLVASENLQMVEERLPFLLDMFARYSFDNDSVWKYPSFELDKIEKRAADLLKLYLNCKYVSLKAISGLNGMLTTIASYNEIGDVVMSLDPNDGGHFETSAIIKKIGFKSEYLPFNKETWQIDCEKLKEYENLDKIRMVYIDLCMAVFPQPIKELKKVLSKDTLIVYDASHVFGLIIGDKFQKPLEEGADILIANTHKTFPGPHKAVFATNRRLLKWQFEQTGNCFISHHHMADVASLGLVLEKGKQYFIQYAKNILKNTQTLARKLEAKNVNVQLLELGYSASHQLWFECGGKEDVDLVIDLLSQVNITVNGAVLPSLNGKWGIRIGTQEITNRGITEEGIEKIASIISKIVNDKELSDDITAMQEYVVQNCFVSPIAYKKVDKIMEILEQ